MILLNKFIEPTFANGKILQAYFIHHYLNKKYLKSVNVNGLYLNTKEYGYNAFTYPVSDEFANERIEKMVHSSFNEEINGWFVREIQKNNKNIKFFSEVCAKCFSRRVDLTFGTRNYFMHTYKCVYYCETCEIENASQVKNLCNTDYVIKRYRRYLNSD